MDQNNNQFPQSASFGSKPTSQSPLNTQNVKYDTSISGNIGTGNTNMNKIPDTLDANHRKVGPIVTILVIVLILIIGGLYLLASKINNQGQVQIPTENTFMQTSAETAGVPATDTPSVQPVTNTADDIQSIQNDLNNSTNGLEGQGL